MKFKLTKSKHGGGASLNNNNASSKKKCIISGVTGMIVGTIITSGIGTAAVTLTADQIKYTPSNENFTVTNAKEALDEIYKMSENTDYYDFSMMWVFSGYTSGSPGYYKETLIERTENEIVPYNISVKTSSTYNGTPANFDNYYWTGTPVLTGGNLYFSVNITLKQDCLYRANETSDWEEKMAGETISMQNMYTNNIGACMLFK